MVTYIITLKWNGGQTKPIQVKCADEDQANLRAKELKVKHKADEVFVRERKNVIAGLLNDADLNLTTVAVG